jgi:hypothetical protein
MGVLFFCAKHCTNLAKSEYQVSGVFEGQGSFSRDLSVQGLPCYLKKAKLACSEQLRCGSEIVHRHLNIHGRLAETLYD